MKEYDIPGREGSVNLSSTGLYMPGPVKTVLLLVVHVPMRLGSMARVVCDEVASSVLDWAAARHSSARPNVIVSFIL